MQPSEYNSCELCPILPKLGTGFYQNQNYIFDILAQDHVRGISRIHLISCPVLRETLQFMWELYLEFNQRLIYKFCSEMLWKCYLGLNKNHADDSVWHSPRIMWKPFICRNYVVESCMSSLKSFSPKCEIDKLVGQSTGHVWEKASNEENGNFGSFN